MPAEDPRDDATLTLADGRVLSAEELAPLVYEDLRRLASSYFRREAPGVTLQPTALVNEACIQLLGQRKQAWESRGHFLALAATAMRRILVDAARERGRQKRGGGWERVTLGDAGGTDAPTISLLDLEVALERLGAISEQYVRMIELRWFAGLTLDETADVLGVSRKTVVRDWARARAWLETSLEEPG